MRTIRICSILVATCWISLSLTSQSEASDRRDSQDDNQPRSPSTWTRLKRRFSGSQRKSRSSVRSTARKDSTDSTPSSIYVQEKDETDVLPLAYGLNDASDRGNGEQPWTSDSLSLANFITHAKRILAFVRHAAKNLALLRQEYLGVRAKYEVHPEEDMLPILRDQCRQIRALNQRIQESAESLLTMMASESVTRLSDDLKVLVLEVEGLAIGASMDHLAHEVADEWCFTDEGQIGPDRWWRTEVLAHISQTLQKNGNRMATFDESSSGDTGAVSTGEEVADGSAAVTANEEGRQPAPANDESNDGRETGILTGKGVANGSSSATENGESEPTPAEHSNGGDGKTISGGKVLAIGSPAASENGEKEPTPSAEVRTDLNAPWTPAENTEEGKPGSLSEGTADEIWVRRPGPSATPPRTATTVSNAQVTTEKNDHIWELSEDDSTEIWL